MSYQVIAKIGGREYSATIELESMISGLVRKGFQETLSDATAGVDENLRDAAIKERLQKIVSGEYTFGAGGGGARLSIDERAERQALLLMLRKVGQKSAIAAKMAAKREEALDAIAKALKADRSAVEGKLASNAAKIAAKMREEKELEIEL